jgi:hypothetical protein
VINIKEKIPVVSGKRASIPIEKEAGWAHDRSGVPLKKEKLSCPCGEEKVIETVSLNDAKCDFRLQPRYKFYLHTSGSETSVRNCHSALRKIPE